MILTTILTVGFYAGMGAAILTAYLHQDALVAFEDRALARLRERLREHANGRMRIEN